MHCMHICLWTWFSVAYGLLLQYFEKLFGMVQSKRGATIGSNSVVAGQVWHAQLMQRMPSPRLVYATHD